MQGNLKQIALPEVLQFISMGKSTGTLSVRDSSNVETVLMILHGRIVNSSALERQRRLGDLLVHRGILKRSALAKALTIQRTQDPGKKIGQILVERDLIQEEQIREVLKLQLEEEIWNLFALTEGDFKFEQAEADQIGEALVQIDIEPLLLEGSRRQDEWQQIHSALPDEYMIIGVYPLPEDKEQWPRLGPAEWRVLSQINGRFPIRALVNRSNMGRFEVYKILVSLLERKLVYVTKPEHPADQQTRESVEEIQQEPAAAAKKAGGFFSKLTGGARKDERKMMEFQTPIGALAFIINQMLDKFHALKENQSGTSDKTLLYHMWSDMLVSFTKADLITIDSASHLNAAQFEDFARHFEFGPSFQDTYEDSLEAMFQLLDGIYRIYSQRTGERTAAKVVREIMDETVPGIRTKFASDLRLGERIQMILRLAA